MNLRSKVATLATGLIVMLGGATFVAPAAHASVSGSVDCTYGNNAEVGVWVEAGARSGWASMWDNGYGGKYYSYGAISAGTSYRLHVGCGGTPQNWGITFYTPWINGSTYDWVCSAAASCVES